MAGFQLVRLIASAILLWPFVDSSMAEDAKPIGDPNPIFMAPKCIVITSYSIAESQADSKLFSPSPGPEEIADFVREELTRAGYDLVATARDEECRDVPPTGEDDRILRVLLRLDFRHAQWSGENGIVVGSAVAVFDRFGKTILSPTPNAIFGGAADDPNLAKRAREAIFDYVHRSVVANILDVSK